MSHQTVTPRELIYPVKDAFFTQDSSQKEKKTPQAGAAIAALLQELRNLLASETTGASSGSEEILQKLTALESTLEHLRQIAGDKTVPVTAKLKALLEAIKECRQVLAALSQAASAAPEEGQQRSFGTISCAAVAFVTRLLSELTDLFVKISGLYTKQTTDQFKMQGDAAIGAAEAAFNSCIDDAKNLKSQMYMSIAGAGVGLAQAGIQMSGFGMGDLQKPLTEAENHLTGLTPLADTFRGIQTPELDVNNGVGREQELQQNRELITQEMTQAVINGKDLADLKNGDNFSLSKEQIAERNLKFQRRLQTADQVGEKEAALKEYNDQVNNATLQVNAYSARIQTRSQMLGMVGQMATGAANAAGQGKQADYAEDKAAQEKAKALQSMDQQLMQQGSSATMDKARAENDQAIADIQALKNFSDACQFRG